MSVDLHPASDAEARRVWPVVRKAHLFDSVESYEEYRAEAPWRIQVSGSGDTAVLERWRDHLDVLAIRGLWCASGQVPVFVRKIAGVAADQGFGRLLSPLVSADVASLYGAAGMRPLVHIVVLLRNSSSEDVREASAPPGVRIRPATPADLGALLELDAACFDEFWRYDAVRLAQHFADSRLMVAEEGVAVIGYTLATIIRDSATLGRVAVSPVARRRGIGGALLSDALAYFARVGMESVSLCTQEENLVSRRLYSAAGMRELPDRLLFLIRDVGGA